MPPVHEKVHAETDQNRQQNRQHTENVGSMFNPEKYARNREEYAERDSCGSLYKGSFCALVVLWIGRSIVVICHGTISLMLSGGTATPSVIDR
jgi:hypothetical protein